MKREMEEDPNRGLLLRQLISLLKQHAAQGEELKQLATRLPCAKCQRIGVVHVELVAPFNAYCDTDCQKSHRDDCQ